MVICIEITLSERKHQNSFIRKVCVDIEDNIIPIFMSSSIYHYFKFCGIRHPGSGIFCECLF